MSGFSLIEFVLVMALFGLVGSLVFPVALTFYNQQVLSEVAGGIESALRTAHVNAVTQKNDTSHGVKLLDDSYVLFTGVSYLDRNVLHDVVVSFVDTVHHTGANEIVFTQATGYPSGGAVIHLNYLHETVSLEVSLAGVVY